MTNEFDQTAFYLAVAKGHLEIVALLCKDTAAANSTFQAAVQLSKHELVRVLIANGVDISTPGVVPNRISSETALFRAVENEDKEMISLLLEHGADISIKQPHDTNETVLHCAARISSEMARLVLKANISQDVLDAQNRIGQTALSYAIGILPWQTREFNDTTTLLLLEAGATIDQKLWNKIPQWFREKHAKYDPSR
ncbi:ankyrin [Stipitochalara longipes BDJ]|nr:ankyrin [Stipitochalara longipes BDJ]